ncbi:MAG: MFS transporter [Promethearchaeota archaeon]
MKKFKNRVPVKLAASQILIFGIIGGAQTFFGQVENGQFNTWINGVIKYEYGGFWAWWMIPLMTTFSALMGLIFMLVWGAYSDRYFSRRWGHRRVFILIGGIVSGIAMLLYLLSRNFWLCFFLDVIVVGIFMNCFLAGNRAIIPEVTEIKERGRVNSYVGIISGIFGFLSIILFLIMDSLFSKESPPYPGEEPHEYLTFIGHFWILFVTGIFYIVVSVVAFFTIKEKEFDPETISKLKSVKWYNAIKQSFSITELKKNKEFFKLIMATLVFNIGIKIFMPWIYEFLTNLPLSFNFILMAILIYIFGGFALSVIFGEISDRYGRKIPSIICIILGSIGFLMVPSAIKTMNLLMLFVMLILMLFLLGGFSTIVSAWTQDLLPKDKMGEFTGINNLASTANQWIGSWIGGIIYALTAGHIEWNMFYSAFVFLASIPIFMFIKETLKKGNASSKQVQLKVNEN